MKPGGRMNNAPSPRKQTGKQPHKPSTKVEEPNVTRRGFLGKTLVTTAGLVAYAIANRDMQTEPKHERRPKTPDEIEQMLARRRSRITPPLVAETIPPVHVEYDLQEHGLGNVEWGPISGMLLGFTKNDQDREEKNRDVRIQKQYVRSISFIDVLKENGRRKLALTNDPAVRALVAELENEYELYYRAGDLELSTIKDVELGLDSMAEDLFHSLNWSGKERESIANLYGLDSKQLLVLKNILAKVRGKCLLSYAMTELLPSDNGELNMKLFDFVLKNGGKRLLARISSNGDKIISFSQYQFTAPAITEKRDSKDTIVPELCRGASLANLALPENQRIPGTLEELVEYDDHSKAAYLFALNNIAYIVSKICNNESMCAQFESLSALEISELLAAAHNNPKEAELALARFLRFKIHANVNVKRTGNLPTEPEPTFDAFFTKKIINGVDTNPVPSHVRKTRNNFLALSKSDASANLD